MKKTILILALALMSQMASANLFKDNGEVSAYTDGKIAISITGASF